MTMTRSELVEELSKYPENDLVFISIGGSDTSIEINEVNHDDYRIFIHPKEYLEIGDPELVEGTRDSLEKLTIRRISYEPT